MAWSAWSWWREPAQPKFVATDYMAQVDKNLQKWKPADAWRLWVEHYRPLAERGLQQFQAYNATQIDSEIAQARFLRRMLWSIAALFAVAALAAIFWPKPVPVPGKTRRQGDKETRKNA
jgi:hypothetical protein